MISKKRRRRRTIGKPRKAKGRCSMIVTLEDRILDCRQLPIRLPKHFGLQTRYAENDGVHPFVATDVPHGEQYIEIAPHPGIGKHASNIKRFWTLSQTGWRDCPYGVFTVLHGAQSAHNEALIVDHILTLSGRQSNSDETISTILKQPRPILLMAVQCMEWADQDEFVHSVVQTGRAWADVVIDEYRTNGGISPKRN